VLVASLARHRCSITKTGKWLKLLTLPLPITKCLQVSTMFASLTANKPCQCRNTDYWTSDWVGTNNPPQDSNSEHRKLRAKQQHVCKEMNQYTNNIIRKWFLSFSIEWTIGARMTGNSLLIRIKKYLSSLKITKQNRNPYSFFTWND
jgi:hypothetical protein